MSLTLNLEYTDFVCTAYGKDFIESVVKATMMASKYAEVLSRQDIGLSIAILETSEMRKVNMQYRGKDKSTDVISVGDFADQKSLADLTSMNEELDLGEVLLCWDFIQESATIQDIKVLYELCYVLAHGTLHLLGYDHSSEMYDIQESIAKTFST